MAHPAVEFLVTHVVRAKFVKLVARTFMKWQQDGCLDLGAAMGYYALFSLFPIILVTLSVFGRVVGPNTNLYSQILTLTEESLPPPAFGVVESTLLQLNEDSVGAGIVGFSLLFIAASNFFSALDRAFDRIWRPAQVNTGDRNLKTMTFTMLEKKFFSFLLVFGSGALLVLSLMAQIVIRIFLRIFEEFSSRITFIELDSVLLVNGLQLVLGFIVLTLVVMILYRALPSVRVTWGDVWLGALLAATLLILLQQLVSNSVVRIGSQFQSYGVIGGVMVLMLWIFLTSQIFFLGGTFTYVYSHMYGSRRMVDASRPSGFRNNS
jgi:membrane protein